MTTDWNNIKTTTTPLKDFIKAAQACNGLGKPPYIRVEVEALDEVNALLAAHETDDKEALDKARQAAFEKLAVIRGPEWAAWAKSVGFGE
jgi:hypothetical protein